jgi:hypothetical protein
VSHNEGIAFAQFRDEVAAEFFIEDYELMKKETRDNEELQELGAELWELKIAPPSNDIIWKNVSNNRRLIKTLLRYLSWSLLIIISVVMITPLTILDNLNPILELLQTYLGEYNYVGTYVQFFLTPL